MKILVRDHTGHTTMEVSTEKDFDRIVKEGMKPHHAAIVRENDTETFLPKKDLTWDRVRNAEEVSMLPMIVGG